MTPRFLVECSPGTAGWLGSVELGEGERALATGASKALLLDRLTSIVAHRAGLAPRTFELVERVSVRPRTTKASSRPPYTTLRLASEKEIRSVRVTAPPSKWTLTDRLLAALRGAWELQLHH
jgi:hypothetical protein